MATGDQNDMLARLQRLMPTGWFSVGAVPVRDAMLTGIANLFAFIFTSLAYVRLQTRIATATDGYLDLIANDFFGDKLQRSPGQSNASYRASIQAAMFRERGTRRAITLVIQQILGSTPTIIEPQFARDTGAYRTPGTLYYGAKGCYGSMRMPKQCFVTVPVPGALVLAPPDVGGYGSPVGAYGTGSQLEYVSIQKHIDAVTAADVYAALDSVRPVTGVIWTQLVPAP